MASPRKTNPTPAEREDAQLIADLMGGGTGHPTEDGGLTLDPIGDPTDRRFPTQTEIARDETAAYHEHGERAAVSGWRITMQYHHEAPRTQLGWRDAVPAGTPVLLANGVLAWSTGDVVGSRLVVALGTIFGPSLDVAAVRPCTEENLPTRYATALAAQLSEALSQIVRNDEDDDLVTRASRMQVEANAIATGLETGTY